MSKSPSWSMSSVLTSNGSRPVTKTLIVRLVENVGGAADVVAHSHTRTAIGIASPKRRNPARTVVMAPASSERTSIYDDGDAPGKGMVAPFPRTVPGGTHRAHRGGRRCQWGMRADSCGGYGRKSLTAVVSLGYKPAEDSPPFRGGHDEKADADRCHSVRLFRVVVWSLVHRERGPWEVDAGAAGAGPVRLPLPRWLDRGHPRAGRRILSDRVRLGLQHRVLIGRHRTVGIAPASAAGDVVGVVQLIVLTPLARACPVPR